MKNNPRPLSAKEKKVLQFIESYIADQGLAPSFRDIKDYFGFASYNSVQNYIKQLQKKNYIYVPGDNQKRAITLLHSSSSSPHHLKLKDPNDAPSTSSTKTPPSPPPLAESLTLPLLGSVAAGLPIEALEYDEHIDVPLSLVKNTQKSCFALRVSGQSMIDEGIFNNDIVVVSQQNIANPGELVVAVVENEATLKRIYFHAEQIELRPSNSTMDSMWYPSTDVEVRGKVVSLLRTY